MSHYSEVCLTNITIPLGRFLSKIQSTNINDLATLKEEIANFQKLFYGIECESLLFKLTNNRQEQDPEAETWIKYYKIVDENFKRPTKIEENTDVILDRSTVTSSNQSENVGTPTIISNLHRNNNTNTTHLSMITSNNTNTPSDLTETSPNIANTSTRHKRNISSSSLTTSTAIATSNNSTAHNQLFMNKKKRNSTQSNSSDESNSNTNKKKRKTPERAAKSNAMTRINELCESSDAESVEVVPSKSSKTEKQSSPSKRVTEVPPIVEAKIQKEDTDKETQGWTDTLKFYAEYSLPNLEKIKSELKTASINSSQATGFNYTKMIKNTIPRHVLNLWKEYPLLFFLVSYKIMQDVTGVVKIIKTVLKENLELGNFYKKMPCSGCPAIDKLHTLIPNETQPNSSTPQRK